MRGGVCGAGAGLRAGCVGADRRRRGAPVGKRVRESREGPALRARGGIWGPRWGTARWGVGRRRRGASSNGVSRRKEVFLSCARRPRERREPEVPCLPLCSPHPGGSCTDAEGAWFPRKLEWPLPRQEGPQIPSASRDPLDGYYFY